jgi:hypothetical protein
LETAQECGYVTQEHKKMSAEFWTAMTEDAKLRVSQTRIISKYLTSHFGTRVCVSEKILSELTSRFIPFKTETLLIGDENSNENVMYSYKDL